MNRYYVTYTAQFAGQTMQRHGTITATSPEDVEQKMQTLALMGNLQITTNTIDLVTE